MVTLKRATLNMSDDIVHEVCRSFLGEWIDPKTNKPRYDGRNNLGVVSINLPRIAIESKGNMHKFWELLDERLEIAHGAIDFRINRFRGVKAKVAPILYTEGALGVRMKPDDEIFDLFKYGRASVSLGYIGIHEVMQLMFANPDAITLSSPLNDEVMQNFGKTVVAYLTNACERWKAESEFGWGYSVYSTPSESLCDRFCKLDRKRFGDIAGITDKGYYTNSFHLDVMKETDPFTKIGFEKDYPVLTPGGHINYVELPDLQHNLAALENVWDYAYSRVPYFGVNMPSDNCHKCGYHGEFDCTNKGFKCPQCGCNDPEKVSVIRRVCGYLGAPDTRPFNEGKQKEVSSRVKHA